MGPSQQELTDGLKQVKDRLQQLEAQVPLCTLDSMSSVSNHPDHAEHLDALNSIKMGVSRLNETIKAFQENILADRRHEREGLIECFKKSDHAQAALLQRIQVVESLQASQKSLFESLEKEQKELRDFLTKQYAKQRQIPLDGLEHVTKLSAYGSFGNFEDWKRSLYAFVAFHPLAKAHLRKEEHDRCGDKARTAKYDPALDAELATLIFWTVPVGLHWPIKMDDWQGSRFMEQIVTECHGWNHKVRA
ncbi:hypothetical protein OC834_004408 [Tilletia horrida]|nr:hypothetical protein OC834_004408 [Tilletia horrida]KAK0534222.1 hypothetical protein OC835_002759 [Tilletia horrida]KAK0555865.1 hypothetical protein OC844_006013 [Tilletia horrida]